MQKIIFALCSIFFAADALAVYRCDAPGGVSYSDTPCRAGKTTDLTAKVNDVASQDGASDARQRASTDKKNLASIEAARAKEERIQERADMAAAKTQRTHAKKCAALALNVKWANEDAASATGRGQQAAQKKARRLQEKQALDCPR